MEEREKTLKKILALILSLALCIALFAGCSSNDKDDAQGSAQSINVYNWGEFIDTDLIDEFEKETGIKVNYTNYATNEELYAKLKSGGASYDVIVPSDYMVSRMIEEDMLEPIDYSKIPNFELMNPQFTHNDFDPNNEYSVAYAWGTVGIIYNEAMLEEGEVVDSWDILWDEKYAGKILMIDNSRDAIGVALKSLGYSLNTTDKAQLDEAYALLDAQAPLVQAYVMDQTYNLMEGGESALAVYYAGDAISMMEVNPDLGFVVPKEGSNVFIDSMCIPKGAKNIDGAHAFIDFMCSTDAMLKNADVTGYSIPQLEAYNELDEETKNDPIMYPSDDVLNSCESFTNLPDEILEYYDTLWAKLKS